MMGTLSRKNASSERNLYRVENRNHGAHRLLYLAPKILYTGQILFATEKWSLIARSEQAPNFNMVG